MRTVWKLDFPIMGDVANGETRELPVGAKFLTCATQYTDDTITAWFEVDPGAEEFGYWFQLFGTGHTITDGDLRYLGTTLHASGSLVLHLYGSGDLLTGGLWVRVPRGHS